jgi:hypothetical protein
MNTNKNKTEVYYVSQVAMVKKCYQYIKDAEATAVEHIIY